MTIQETKAHGLVCGGMDYKDIGFSNIRLPNDEGSYIYKYDIERNLFPEETFIHEFLHTLERISREYGLDYPLLHDYEMYGYKVEYKTGLRDWYHDFMTKNIQYNGENIGLNSAVYKMKPVHPNAFQYSMKLGLDNDPDNIIEEIRLIIKTIMNSTKYWQRSETTDT